MSITPFDIGNNLREAVERQGKLSRKESAQDRAQAAQDRAQTTKALQEYHEQATRDRKETQAILKDLTKAINRLADKS